MLDFSKLKTPPSHDSVLVEPAPQTWSAIAKSNSELLGGAKKMLLGKTLADWRKQVRNSVVGQNHSLVLVTGHQPAFIHPGVWAKHVVAQRAAKALHAVALNLIVDNDAVNQTTLSIPTIKDGVASIVHNRFVNCPSGTTYEQIPAMSGEILAQFENDISALLGEHYEISQWPKFFSAIIASNSTRDWVDQQVLGRQAIENSFGINLVEQRVSGAWCTPLIADILLNANEFAACYNRAIANYRRNFRVRGRGQPIPDLVTDSNLCEVPLWVFSGAQPRQRLFVERDCNTIKLYADRTYITCIDEVDVQDCVLFTEKLGDWRIRPRALSLTLWARLLLADLFVHGIGGAKYDRITDAIIEDYYQVKAPAMACVSATLHLNLPTSNIDDDAVRRLCHKLRDMRHNPQRHIKSNANADVLVQQRHAAVVLSDELARSDPNNHAARQEVFNRIKLLNAELLEFIKPLLHNTEDKKQETQVSVRNDQVARNRELFFGHFDNHTLQMLLDALPTERSFAV